MLAHHSATPANPNRVVVLGGNGFVGRSLVALLEKRGVDFLAIGSADLDLAAAGADSKLSALLRPDDAVVILAALTPDRGRDVATLMKNLLMVQACLQAAQSSEISHLVYISSDAVYPLSCGTVSESSCAEPSDLYGAMHHTRELMFGELKNCPVAILRPTLIFGPGDPHNSYGPNRFRRVARENGKIVLGGKGEETRDHIYVEDAAQLICLTLSHRSAGLLNIATGTSHSFDEVANAVVRLFKQKVEVKHTERNAPITHRSFDVTERIRAFPEFSPVPLEEGLKLTMAAEA